MPNSATIKKSCGRGLAGWQAELVMRLLGNPSGDLPVAALARSCGLSRSYFIRAFKLSMGLPPHHWLMQRRVDRARELLARTGDSIAEIAIACGFADQSHLTRVFHQIVGESPAAWRRRRRAHAAETEVPCPATGGRDVNGTARRLPTG